MQRPRSHVPTLLLALLILYGSLYPFRYVAPASFRASLVAFLSDGRLWTSRGDELGNVALFVPLGAVVAISLAGTARRRVALVAGFLACVALSFVIQVLQIYFPPREAGLADVLANAAGTLVGMACGWLIARTRQLHLPHVGPEVWVVLAILAAWMLGNLWPFVPSIDWQGWKESVKPLFIRPTIGWTSLLFHLVAVYMLGELIGSVVPPERRNRLVGLLIGMTATGKLVIVGQTLQPSFLIGSALGVVTLPAFRRLARFRVPVLLSLLFAIYTARSVLPLELRDAPADISWIPFASLLNGEMDINAASLGNAIYFFAGMVWLVARMHGRVMPVTIALACWVTLIEFAQRWLDGHGADTTPPLLALAAGLAIRLAGVPHEPASGTPSPTAPTRGDASAPRAAVLATRHDR